MNAAVVISGRMGAGKSTLLRALIEHAPETTRCMTITIDRKPKAADVVHPTRADWSEFNHVTPDYFDALIETEQLLVPAKQEQKDFRVGFLYATIESVLGFGGLVLLNMPPAYFDPVRMLFAQYRRTVHGFYLDVPEAVVHARLLRRGAGEEEARMKMRLTADWRDQAKALGFTLIENPEEDDHYPHQALEAVLKKLGTTTELIPVA
ncbi:MAG TPA: hypothetical protein VHD38_03775 [Candidatus Paceibacterota bacterium]|nr:hypothetical protein [Candidatus Paceibacterota bacterium]